MRSRSAFLFTSLAWFAGFLGFVQGAPANEPRTEYIRNRVRTSWEMYIPCAAQGKSPVWVGTHELEGYAAQKPIQDIFITDIYDAAASFFNWVKGQPDVLTGPGNLLVAAFFDPDTRMVYASTIPRGEWADYMSKEKSKAPVWEAHYNKIGKKTLHAEDGAYYWYEIEAGKVELDESPGDKTYGERRQHGAKIAVWGEFYSKPDKIGSARGGPVDLCSKDGSSCTGLATSLGVYTDSARLIG